MAGCEFMSIIFTPNSIQIAQNTTNFNPNNKIKRIVLVLSIILNVLVVADNVLES